MLPRKPFLASCHPAGLAGFGTHFCPARSTLDRFAKKTPNGTWQLSDSNRAKLWSLPCAHSWFRRATALDDGLAPFCCGLWRQLQCLSLGGWTVLPLQVLPAPSTLPMPSSAILPGYNKSAWSVHCRGTWELPVTSTQEEKSPP